MREVQLHATGHIAEIRLNRPEKLNALSDGMVREIGRLLEEFDGNPDFQVAIITGEGRAFCAGADVQQRQLRPREELTRFGGPSPKDAKTPWLMFKHVFNKPVISAVHGYTLGAGLIMALASDYIVAADDTQFQVSEVVRGLDPAVGRAFLRYRCSGAFADDVTLTCRYFSAAEARQFGMLTHVVPLDDLPKAALAVAESILANPPLSVRAMVKERRFQLERIELEARRTLTHLHDSRDFLESARAFAEKRPHSAFQAE